MMWSGSNKWVFLVTLVSSLGTQGQNLVPNGSFEEYTQCPEFISSVFLTGWENLHTNSADYFNACSDSGVADVPLNQCGYQFAADGQAYIGMATSAPGGSSGGLSWYREIVGIELQTPLQIGVPICLSFKTAMGGFGNSPVGSTPFSCRGLGLKFFTSFPSDWTSYLYPNTAALSIELVPTDTAIWYHVSGFYVPDSAYTQVAVGNFFADSLNQLTIIDSTGYGNLLGAYAFVDDIRVSFDLAYCDAPLVVSGLPKEVLVLYPQPFVDGFRIRWSGRDRAPVLRFTLLDVGGRIIRSGVPERMEQEDVFLFAGLPSGTYVLELSFVGGGRSTLPVMCVSP